MSRATIELPAKLVPVFGHARGKVRYRCAFGGRGCLHPDALIDTPSGQIKVSEFEGGQVYSWDQGRVVIAEATAAVEFTEEDLFEVVLDDGRSIIATDQHKFLTPDGWRQLCSLSIGANILSSTQKGGVYLRASYYACDQSMLRADVRRCLRITEDCPGHCSECFRRYDQRPQSAIGNGLSFLPSPTDARQHNCHASFRWDDQATSGKHNLSSTSPHHSTLAAHASLALRHCEDLGNCICGKISELLSGFSLSPQLSPQTCDHFGLDQILFAPHQDNGSAKNLGRTQQTRRGTSWRGDHDSSSLHDSLDGCGYFKICKVEIIRKHSRRKYWDLHVFGTNNYLSNGIVNHNSGKSYSFALMAATFGYRDSLRILCTREFQTSIRESFHAELRTAIEAHPWLAAHYEVGVEYIKGKNGTEFFFRGLRNSMNAIKSLAHVDLTIVEEAEDVPEQSWQALLPTVMRQPGSEVWAIWNPRGENSPVDKRFRKQPPTDAVICELNWNDNPFFPAALDQLRQDEQTRLDPATYAHIWDGAYLSNSNSQVFAGRYSIEPFEPRSDWDGPYQGGDFGFAQDPTAAVRVWVHDQSLWIQHEATKTGLELDHMASFVGEAIPGFADYAARWDSARPESISYLKRHGMPNTQAVDKWPGSVEDGVGFLKSFRRIVVHPRCKETAREMRLYSYKVDRLTGDILPTIIDAHNHCIDAIRYAVTPMIRRKGSPRIRIL